jgi:hypothetical protein
MYFFINEKNGFEFSDDVEVKLGEFVHISFNGKLEGIWKPKLPDSDGISQGGKFSEPEWKRTSVSPNVELAFRAIYPNVSRIFEEMNEPSMDFHVYSPNDQRATIITPENLIKHKLVHDAHITQEHVFLTDIEMKHTGKIRVYNTSNNKGGLFYTLFDKKSNENLFHSPRVIKIKKIA